MTALNMTVNGEAIAVDVEDSRYLSEVLRDELGLTGTKNGCSEAECGVCEKSTLCMSPPAKHQQNVDYEGQLLNVQWLQHSKSQGDLKIVAVDERLNGPVQLEDGSAFENPIVNTSVCRFADTPMYREFDEQIQMLQSSSEDIVRRDETMDQDHARTQRLSRLMSRYQQFH